MLAARPTKRGDLIMAYTPYLIAHISKDDLSFTETREKMLGLAVEQLPQPSRNAYLALAKVYDEPDIVVQDILKANAFNMQIDGSMYPAIFPEAARMNHACAPNAQYSISSDRLTQYVHAVRPIAKDEEITISYAPPLRLHADRQRFFKSNFQFTCTCQRCSPGLHNISRTVEDSDKATQGIVNLQWELLQETHSANVKKTEMLVKLYKDEGVDAFLDTVYGRAALAYNRAGSVRGALKYGRLAAEATRLRYGSDEKGTGRIAEWESFARDPMGHVSWRNKKTSL